MVLCPLSMDRLHLSGTLTHPISSLEETKPYTCPKATRPRTPVAKTKVNTAVRDSAPMMMGWYNACDSPENPRPPCHTRHRDRCASATCPHLHAV